jgi:hypothetical protein
MRPSLRRGRDQFEKKSAAEDKLRRQLADTEQKMMVRGLSFPRMDVLSFKVGLAVPMCVGCPWSPLKCVREFCRSVMVGLTGAASAPDPQWAVQDEEEA